MTALVFQEWAIPEPLPPRGWPTKRLGTPCPQRRHVAYGISGSCRVDLARLGLALGKGALATWELLCGLRSSGGYTRATALQLARRLGKRERYAEKALAKLELAGLLERKGWRTEVLPTKPGGKDLRPVDYFQRRVYGAWYGPGENGGKALVPEETARWLLERPATWGGKRPGSGPKRRIQEGGKPPPKSLFKRGTQGSYIRSQDLDKNLAATHRGGRGSPVSFLENQMAPEEVPPLPAPLPRRPGPYAFDPARMDPDRLPGVPKCPNLDRIGGMVRVPSPPRLAAGQPPEERARLLAAAFRGAMAKRTGKPCWAFRGKDPTRWKDYGLMLKVADALQEADIPPVHWVAWSIDIWQKGKSKESAPPARYVFSPKRVAERGGWCRSEYNGYGWTSQVVRPRLGMVLWTRWNDMANELKDPRNDITETVARYFPGDLYDRMLAAARHEVAEARSCLERQLAAGDWLWSA